MRLRTKINIASIVLVLVVVAGMMGSLYLSEKKNLWAEAAAEQKEDLSKLDRVFTEAMVQDDQLIYLNYVKTLVASPKVMYAGFVSQDGHGWLYMGVEKDLVFTGPEDQQAMEAVTANRFRRQPVSFPTGEEVIEMSRPSRNGDIVRLGFDRKELEAAVQSRLALVLRKLMIVGAAAVLFGLILSYFLSGKLSEPILNLMDGANLIAKGEKGVHIPEGGKDELGQLTRTFNHMSIELAKLDELKDEFMAHVTHELRSPLTSIIATVDLLDEMPKSKKDAKMERSIERLRYGSERLNRLVDNILDLTRLEAGKMQFDIQPANLGTLACEMADFFEPRAMEKGLSIQADVPERLPMAMGDVERVRQILSNLIHNAIKFTNTGGITIWVRHKKEEVHVGVSDTGVGIPRDKLKKVFSKFETLQDTKDRVSKAVPGTGLGLNIVLNSIRAQKGRIWVESEVDKGTTFTFTLPVASHQAPEMPQKPSGERHDNKDRKGGNRGPVVIKPDEEAV